MINPHISAHGQDGRLEPLKPLKRNGVSPTDGECGVRCSRRLWLTHYQVDIIGGGSIQARPDIPDSKFSRFAVSTQTRAPLIAGI